MSYAVKKRSGYRQYVEIFEIDLDINDPSNEALWSIQENSFGTPRTTQGTPSVRPYKKGEFRTYRYTNTTLPTKEHHFPGYDAVASNFSGAKLDPGEKVSLSGSANIVLADFPDNLTYSLQGVYANKRPAKPVSHFKALFARNYIENRPARIKRGYITDGVAMTDADFQIEHYVIQTFTPPDSKGKVTFKLIDRMFFASESKNKCPVPCNALLNTTMDETNNSTITEFDFVAYTFGNRGIGDLPPEVNEEMVFAIGDEIMKGKVTAYDAGSTAGTMQILERAMYGTEFQEHSQGDDIQGGIDINRMPVMDFIKMLTYDFTNLGDEFIDEQEFADYTAGEMLGLDFTTVLIEPKTIRALFDEAVKSTGMWLYFDVIKNRMQAGVITRYDNPIITLTEDEHILENSLSVRPQTAKQATRATIYYSKITPLAGDKMTDFYKRYRKQNDLLELDEAYGQVVEGQVIKTSLYGHSAYDVVNAQRVVQLKIVRFADVPDLFKFKLDATHVGELPNGENLWYGSVVAIANRTKFHPVTLENVTTLAQIISMKPSYQLDNWEVEALAYSGEELPDVDYVIEESAVNINVAQLMSDAGVDTTVDRTYTVIVNTGVVIGSADLSVVGLDTGSFGTGTAKLHIINMGILVGKGGRGSSGGAASFNYDQTVQRVEGSNPTNGGDAITLNVDTIIDNLQGMIGGGGAGGRAGYATSGKFNRKISIGVGAAGGGGAGYQGGDGGQHRAVPLNIREYANDPEPMLFLAELYGGNDGTLSFGGDPALPYIKTDDHPYYIGDPPSNCFGEKGGDLGKNTQYASAGKAINQNGFGLTFLSGDNPNQVKGLVF